MLLQFSCNTQYTIEVWQNIIDNILNTGVTAVMAWTQDWGLLTSSIIVARERDESLTQTLEEYIPGGEAYTMYVAWSRMSAKGDSLFAIVI